MNDGQRPVAVHALTVRPAPVAVAATGRARDRALVAIAVTGAGLCVAAVLLAASGPNPNRVDRGLREGLIVGLPLIAGIYAARSRRDARFGFLLIAAGFCWSITALAQSTDSLLYSVGRVSAWLIFPPLFYVMLTFPDGRLPTRRDRRLMAAGVLLVGLLYIGSAFFVEAYPLHTPWATCTTDCPANAFLAVGHEPALMAAVVEPLREVLTILLLTAVTASIVARVRVATRLRRRLISPVAAMGIVSSVILAAFLAARRVGDPGVTATLGTLWSLCVPGIAAACLVGLLQRRLVMGSVLKRLSGELSGDVGRHELRGALARALDDPSADLLIADAVLGGWQDAGGRPASPADSTAQGRAVTVIEHEGTPVAALVHEPALRDDDELLEGVGSQILGALEHERLTARLRTSLTELAESRSRIAAAADVERVRIERDLHDGAQQRLIKIRIGLALAEEAIRADPEAAAAALRGLGEDIDAALDDVRSLAHGVYPSLLSDRGLEDALRSVAAESPLPVRVDAQDVTRHRAEVETAVYFTCVEALQNAIKHAAGATRVWIGLRQDAELTLSVRDDGSGFVPPRGADGGLRNMRDRIEAVGGRLAIESHPGDGTLIRADVPIADATGTARAGARSRPAR
jgi:signal transduction histidine kinase